MDAILEHEMNMLLQEAEQVAIKPGVTTNDSELPKGWFSATTPEGKVYYYNTETQESRWDKPSMPKQPSNYVAGSSSQQSFRASGTVRGTSFSNPAKITDAVDPAVNATSGANMPTKKPPMPNKLRALPATSSPNTYTSVRESSPTLKITPSIQQAFTTQSSPSNAIIAPGRSISDASTYTGSIDGKSKLTINTTIETNILTSASHLAPQKSAPSAFYGTGAPLSSSSTQLFKRSSAESLNSSALDEQARKRVESAPINAHMNMKSELRSKVGVEPIGRNTTQQARTQDVQQERVLTRSDSSLSTDLEGGIFTLSRQTHIFSMIFDEKTTLTLSALDPKLIRCHGYLTMKILKTNESDKSVSNYVPFYIILYFGLLIFFREPPFKTKKPKGIGIIDIAQSSVEPATVNHTNRKYGIVIRTPANVEIIFTCGTENDRNEWIKRIRADIADRGKEHYSDYLTGFVNTSPQESRTFGSVLGLRRAESSQNSLLSDNRDKSKDSLEPVFGGTLDTLYKRSKQIPVVVEVCAKLIETKGKDVVGIYRHSSDREVITRLRGVFNHGEETTVNWMQEVFKDINVAADLLKLFFWELQMPLIPVSSHDELLQLAKTPSISIPERIARISGLFSEYSESHRVVLRYLLRHLTNVAKCSDKNDMDIKNLAAVFAPILLKFDLEQTRRHNIDRDYAQLNLMEFMITHFDKLLPT